MAARPRVNTYREILGARVASRKEAEAAGLRGRAYVLPGGSVVSRRQLEQRAFARVGLDYRTLEGRSARLRGEHPPGSYTAAVRFWARQHGQSFRQAQQDPRFKGAWSRKRGGGRAGAAEAYELLGIIRRGPDGKWRYTNEFDSWLVARSA